MPGFVVHEHHARRLHWDLRLEMEGVLRSWAVPKGMPLEPGVRRLAVEVEDHPLDYIDFEGEIPEGDYGAGTVGIWDRGAYELESRSEGALSVRFEGERLRGRYKLVKTGFSGGKGWLVFRRREGQEAKAAPKKKAPSAKKKSRRKSKKKPSAG